MELPEPGGSGGGAPSRLCPGGAPSKPVPIAGGGGADRIPGGTCDGGGIPGRGLTDLVGAGYWLVEVPCTGTEFLLDLGDRLYCPPPALRGKIMSMIVIQASACTLYMFDYNNVHHFLLHEYRKLLLNLYY